MDNLLDEPTVLIEYQCFGNINFWIELAHCPNVFFEHYEKFQKNGFRNRYQVLSSNGVLTLTVPVVGGRETKELTSVVKIDNSTPWQAQHWKTIQSCYNKSPFFQYYQMGLSHLYQNTFQSLIEFDLATFDWVSKALKLKVGFRPTQSFTREANNLGTKDLRGQFRTGNRLNRLQTKYIQVFGTGFHPNLSILDLLFNLGPESKPYLTDNYAISTDN